MNDLEDTVPWEQVKKDAGLSDASLPHETDQRKGLPLARGLLDYFPNALAYVARVSKAGNDKHNPGEEMHHARGKSMDHADCLLRHLVDRGRVDPEDGLRHSAKVAWRALALLQEELEREEGAPLPRGARVATEKSVALRPSIANRIPHQKQEIYNDYYGFDPKKPIACCTHCEKVLVAADDFILVSGYPGGDRAFCSMLCSTEYTWASHDD